MILKELIEKIKSDSIEIDFGKAFLDLNNPKDYLIESLEEQLERFAPDTDEKKNFFKKLFGKKDPSELDILPTGALSFGLLTCLELHSYITNEDLYICLNDNKITFKQFDYSKDYPKGERGMIEPNIEEGIEKPLKTSIEVPSKKVIFTNFFPDNISPEMEYRYSSKNSLCGLVGRRNHARHYEKHGVLYGQTGNMGLIIWVNPSKTEIIITSSNWNTYEELYGSSIEDFDTEEDYNEFIKDYNNDELEVVKYLIDNNFEQVGRVSCDMWRFEATDYEKGKEIIEFKNQNKNDWNYRDILVVDIAGTKVSMEHYFDSIEKSPISNMIVSKITVE